MVCWELVRKIWLADICWSGCVCIGQEGQVMLEEDQGLCRWSTVTFCARTLFSGTFEEAMRWCGCALMEAGYCVPVHPKLRCSVQRILPHRMCA